MRRDKNRRIRHKENKAAEGQRQIDTTIAYAAGWILVISIIKEALVIVLKVAEIRSPWCAYDSLWFLIDFCAAVAGIIVLLMLSFRMKHNLLPKRAEIFGALSTFYCIPFL